MDHHGKQIRVVEVAQKLDQGATVAELARHYNVTTVTIWRWGNEGRAALIPHMEDRDKWRGEVLATLTERLTKAITRDDDKTIIKITESLRKMLGLDHADMVNEAYLRIEARKLDMLATALERAADRAKLSIEVRIELGHALDEELAQLESKTDLRDAS